MLWKRIVKKGNKNQNVSRGVGNSEYTEYKYELVAGRTNREKTAAKKKKRKREMYTHSRRKELDNEQRGDLTGLGARWWWERVSWFSLVVTKCTTRVSKKKNSKSKE